MNAYYGTPLQNSVAICGSADNSTLGYKSMITSTEDTWVEIIRKSGYLHFKITTIRLIVPSLMSLNPVLIDL